MVPCTGTPTSAGEGAGQIPEVKAGRRDTISLYADIIWAIGSGARKSRIVYGANLSFGRCGRYLDELLGLGLIMKTGSPPAWAVTERGREFLRKYGELGKLLGANYGRSTPRHPP